MATRTNHELPCSNGDEEDALSRRARALVGLNRYPGVPRWWKRNYNKRVRKTAKTRIARNLDGWD